MFFSDDTKAETLLQDKKILMPKDNPTTIRGLDFTMTYVWKYSSNEWLWIPFVKSFRYRRGIESLRRRKREIKPRKNRFHGQASKLEDSENMFRSSRCCTLHTKESLKRKESVNTENWMRILLVWYNNNIKGCNTEILSSYMILIFWKINIIFTKTSMHFWILKRRLPVIRNFIIFE